MRQQQMVGWAGRLAQIVLALVVGLAGSQALAQVASTKHNLGVNGPGPNKLDTGGTTEVCVFCHTPHGASTTTSAPLWNKNLGDGSGYTMYNTANSVTMDGQVLADVGSVSLACLSCHDGAQAMDNILNAPGSGGFSAGGGAIGLEGAAWTWANVGVGVDANGRLTSVANLGTDLSNDHPIGVEYCGGGWSGPTATGPCKDSDFYAPQSTTINTTKVFWVDTSAGTGGTRDKTDMILYNRGFTLGTGPSVECASCHDPHVADTTDRKTFLRIANTGSAVCLACHNK